MGTPATDGAAGRNTHRYVVDLLGRRIVSGSPPPGAPTPVESALCLELGVSRGALREGVKALVAKGLLEVRPRTGTRVRPRTEWNVLDPDVLAWLQFADQDRLLRNLVELRRQVEPGAARLAAARAGEARIAALLAACDRMEAAAEAPGHAGFTDADVEFHLAVLDACGNELFAALGRALQITLTESFRLTQSAPHAVELTLPMHRQLADAIAAHDEDAADAAARELVDESLRHLEAVNRRIRRLGTVAGGRT